MLTLLYVLVNTELFQCPWTVLMSLLGRGGLEFGCGPNMGRLAYVLIPSSIFLTKVYRVLCQSNRVSKNPL